MRRRPPNPLHAATATSRLALVAAAITTITVATRAVDDGSTETLPKNIIILVADGAGYNTLRATELWRGAKPTYASDDWLALAMATYSLRVWPTTPVEGPEGLAQDPAVVYDSKRAWDSTPIEGESDGFPFHFAGYQWLRTTRSDSAATMTAMMTGVKTYNGAINVDGNGTPLESVPERAKARGKRVGSISSVAFTHATVASGAGAHHVARSSYHEIAHEIFRSGVCNVIGGAGNPDYSAQGNPARMPLYQWVSEDDWVALKEGALRCRDGSRWTLLQTREEIESLVAEGGGADIPDRLAIIPRAFDTLQQTRRSAHDPKLTAPGDDPLKDNVPSLATMTKLALDALDDDPDGFFLHVEGGAVDWAMHGHHFGRMIEEYTAFLDAVDSIVAYLDAGTNGNTWENTLVIVTADHDHLLFGPESDTIAFQEPTDNGAGALPGYAWHDRNHGNLLVPLFARGPGAAALRELADQIDVARVGDRNVGRGTFLHQDELGRHLMSLLAPASDDTH